jgi:hypothetical protein
MATIQSVDFRVLIEPTIVTPEFDFGPSDSVAANAVLLTREFLRNMGAYPVRNGHDWDCKLHIVQSIAGVETAVDLTDMTIAGTYWDWVTRTANTLTVAKTVAASGELTVSFAAATLPTAGMYEFAITATETELFDLCSGKLEILPAIPT